MIIEKQEFNAVCCNCGEVYQGDWIIAHYNRGKLIKNLKADGWQIIYEGSNMSETTVKNIYCPECHDKEN